jgi:hypothetical protein
VAGLSAFYGGSHDQRGKRRYDEPELLGDILKRVLAGRKFRLHCGHHVTFGPTSGNDVTIRNGKEYKIICSQCGY